MKAQLLSEMQRHTGVEMGNSVMYLRLFAAALAAGFPGFARVFRENAESELGHAVRWAARIAQEDSSLGPGIYAHEELTEPEPVAAMCADAEKLEIDTTASMRAVLSVAEADGDGAAIDWISAQLTDQVADEKEARDFARRVAMAEENGCLVLLDRELAK